ncbi:hypothetical protein [Paraglaciecola sp. 25GB23A]|uniref:hypothetical protein n=1 Tax=Paraglaciecola sp. 25GB23A TaxID=3156068 RepID=UPI0032AF5458
MEKLSLPRRALKYAIISSFIIMVFALFRILISGAVGTPMEVFGRVVISAIAAFFAMWVVFIAFLFFNPDADKPRNDS